MTVFVAIWSSSILRHVCTSYLSVMFRRLIGKLFIGLGVIILNGLSPFCTVTYCQTLLRCELWMSVYFTGVRTLFCVENASSVSGCCMFAALQEYLCCYLVVTFFIYQWLEKPRVRFTSLDISYVCSSSLYCHLHVDNFFVLVLWKYGCCCT